VTASQSTQSSPNYADVTASRTTQPSPPVSAVYADVTASQTIQQQPVTTVFTDTVLAASSIRDSWTTSVLSTDIAKALRAVMSHAAEAPPVNAVFADTVNSDVAASQTALQLPPVTAVFADTVNSREALADTHSDVQFMPAIGAVPDSPLRLELSPSLFSHLKSDGKSTKKKQRKPGSWKVKMRKEARARGLQYTSASGTVHGPKKPSLDSDICSCRH